MPGWQQGLDVIQDESAEVREWPDPRGRGPDGIHELHQSPHAHVSTHWSQEQEYAWDEALQVQVVKLINNILNLSLPIK